MKRQFHYCGMVQETPGELKYVHGLFNSEQPFPWDQDIYNSIKKSLAEDQGVDHKLLILMSLTCLGSV